MAPADNKFREAARTGLIPANAAAAIAATVVSAGLSLYADLFHGALPVALGNVALFGWTASLVLILYLAGRDTGQAGHWNRVVEGARLARGNLGFAFLVLALSGGAVFTIWSKLKSDQGGALASLVRSANLTQQAANAAASAAASTDRKADSLLADTNVIRAAVTRVLPPAEALARLGYTTSDGDACKAANAGNDEAMSLFRLAGVTSPSLAQSTDGVSGFCLEPLLMKTGREVALSTVFEHFAPRPKELNARYVSQAYAGRMLAFDDLRGLLAAARLVTLRKPRLLDVRATPLMMAVWGRNAEALKALLKQGAEPNAASKIMVSDELNALQLFTVIVTPLEEARRLNFAAGVTLLEQRGATSLISLVATLEE